MKILQIASTTPIGKLEEAAASASAQKESLRFTLSSLSQKTITGQQKSLAALATANGKASVVVKTGKWDEASVGRIRAEFDGLLALHRGLDIVSARGERFPISRSSVYREVFELQRGRLEAFDSKRFTFVACDSQDKSRTFSRPALMSGSFSTESFRIFLSNYVARALNLTGDRFVSTASNHFRLLAQVCYELFSNTEKHAVHGGDGLNIEGIRLLSITRHVRNAGAMFENIVPGFDELNDYFFRVNSARIRRPTAFLEIGISDCGLGIVDHFLKDRDASRDSGSPSEFDVMSWIGSKRFSSSPVTNTGAGLRDAIRATASLKGFVLLRTNRFHAYGAFPKGIGAAEQARLRPLGSATTANVQGTHFSVWIPWSRS